MTAPSLLDELEGVVRRITDDAAEVRRTGGDPERERHTQRIAVNFIRTHHAEIADMAKRMEAAERDAFKWQLLCADCDDAGEGNRAAINAVNDACRLGSGALERHYGQAARDGLDAAIAATQEGEG